MTAILDQIKMLEGFIFTFRRTACEDLSHDFKVIGRLYTETRIVGEDKLNGAFIDSGSLSAEFSRKHELP